MMHLSKRFSHCNPADPLIQAARVERIVAYTSLPSDLTSDLGLAYFSALSSLLMALAMCVVVDGTE